MYMSLGLAHCWCWILLGSTESRLSVRAMGCVDTSDCLAASSPIRTQLSVSRCWRYPAIKAPARLQSRFGWIWESKYRWRSDKVGVQNNTGKRKYFKYNFSTYLRLPTHLLTPLAEQSVLGSAEHKVSSSETEVTTNSHAPVEILPHSYPLLFSWSQVDRVPIVLSTHQNPICTQGHYQTVNVLQKGAWESHSNWQDFIQGVWQHWVKQNSHLLAETMAVLLLVFKKALSFTFRCWKTESFIHCAQLHQVRRCVRQRLPCIRKKRFSGLVWIRGLKPNCKTVWLHCLKMYTHHIHINVLSLDDRLHVPTIEIVFRGKGADVVYCGDGDVSIQTNKSGRWKLLFKSGYLSKDMIIYLYYTTSGSILGVWP